MYLAKELHQLADPKLPPDQRAQLRCQVARQLEEAGDYEAAREALGYLWQGIGERPVLEGLDRETAAEVLLRVGALTGWLGSVKQIGGSQEIAKDLTTESVTIFEELGKRNKAAEARSDLAVCYWREGGFDEARVLLQQALAELDEGDVEQRAIALLRRALVERASKRFNEALRIYNEAAAVFERTTSHLLKAQFHNGLANVLNQLSAGEHHQDYIDRALIEYAAASFHFEQAGHERYQGCVENNLGFLFSTIGKFTEAHEHLDRAQVIYTALKDDHVAQIDETRARVLLAEGRVVEAEKTVRAAVHRLEKGDELSLLAEALTTHGVTLARLNHREPARSALERAANVAERAGDFESAGMAALTLIEELETNLSHQEVWATIDRAGVLLERTQDVSTLRRLAKAAFQALHGVPAPHDWTDFSFWRAVHRYEAYLIKLALEETGGMVTRAARLLGFKHHQSLVALIDSRHKDLLEKRSPVRKRRQHLLAHPKRAKKKKVHADHAQGVSQISILHVEDNQLIAKLVDEMAAAEDWRVELCADGDSALRKLTGNDHYDLLLVDNDLPGLSGLELVQRARKITHRRRTPIVMLSGNDSETEAWRAGVDAFLKKPEQINELTSTIARLLKDGSERA